ncbi:tetratricopeptide repeat protein [Solihabitans fulvus]|uniref:Tetratricopeptide repeat protein n=1 Tax=Solihabitans fulvus TaxID=1892852 RepID=A0A5B2WAD5_9PSEU|nr:tetratricopeptide repeat protein [Solihabitans fulvus]KAA2247297.1 tetratricopeptide repeat protein [Solihabitans fulvus]
MLIVLDNARDSKQVVPLLPGTPSCTVLVTSRDRMAELVTGHSAQPVTVQILDEEQARELLSRRLGKQRLAAEPDAVADLLRWCGGLPLALSIVAGRATLDPQIPLAELAAELRDTSSRLSALDPGGSATSLETVLSWSYRALAPEQARVFALLGLTPGPDISLPAAANLTGLPQPETLSALRALEQFSLVQQHASKRYRMHDLVRLYAKKQAQTDDSDSALQRLATFACHTAHAADLLIAPSHVTIELDELVAGCEPQTLPDDTHAWEWLSAEHTNLMAIQHAALEKHWYPTVWQLAWAMTTFNLRKGHFHENLAAWQAGLEAAKHLSDPIARTRAYRHLGRAYALLGLHDQSLPHLQEGLAWAQETHDRLGAAHTHRAVAVAWEQQEKYELALEHSRRALDLYGQLGVARSGAHALNEVGWYTAKLGDFDQARVLCARALAQCRGEQDRSGQATALLSLGYIAHHTDDIDQATRNYQQSLALYQDLGDVAAEASVLDHLGDATVHADPTAARQAWEHASDLYQAQGRADDTRRVQQKIATLD